MAELTGAVKEGLLALAVGAGLRVVAAMMEESVFALAGPKGRHDPNRIAVRHGSEDGAMTLGGRRVPVRQPRVRSADGAAEGGRPRLRLFASTDLLGDLALERMMATSGLPRIRLHDLRHTHATLLLKAGVPI